jgi:hypothetical protein
LAKPFSGWEYSVLSRKGNPQETVTEFRRILLRNSGNDYYSTLFRDALMQDLVKQTPLATMAYQPVVHFINGEFWGIINLRERYDEYYLQSHYGVDPDEVVILDGLEVVDVGEPDDANHFLETVSYAENNDLQNTTHFDWVKDRIDLENLAHYYAAQIYFYNTDWPQNNYNIWRMRSGTLDPTRPYGHDGRWRWLLFDTDFGMNLYDASGHYRNGLIRILDGSAQDAPSRLFRRLLINQSFRNLFANVVSDQLNSCFQPTFIKNKIDVFNAALADTRAEHWNRWMSGTDNGSVMKTFADQRPPYVRVHMQSGLGLEAPATLTVSRSGGGLVKVNSVVIDGDTPGITNSLIPYPWIGTFFRNVPITLTALNTPGYAFSHWEGLEGVLMQNPRPWR